MITLETNRLRLREFTRDDLDVLSDLVGDPEQMTFYPCPKTRDEAAAWIERNLALYKEHRFGFWVVEWIEGSDFLGYCGIRPLELAGVEEIEMGWHVRKEFWGQGLATEAASACRDLAFDGFKIQRLVATIDPEHAASVRVAEKIGMKRERDAILDSWRCEVYSVARSTDDEPQRTRLSAARTFESNWTRSTTSVVSTSIRAEPTPSGTTVSDR